MILLLFWIKVAVKRVIGLFKSSPGTIVLAFVFLGAFIFAFANNYIELAFDTQFIFLMAMLLTLFSLLSSIKNYQVMPVLIIHSKGKYNNKVICAGFFAKQAVKNNLLLLIFNIVAYNSLPNKNHFACLLGLSIISMSLSFLVMYSKSHYTRRKVNKPNAKAHRINPVVKSTLYDYSALLPTAIMCIVLCLFFTFLVMGESLFHIDLEIQYTFFTLVTLFFSFGFLGLVESVPKINWKYQAIISPNDFYYHFKRTLFLFAGLFGPLLVPLIIVSVFINLPLLLKHLYCILVLMIITINIAFTVSHMLLKFFTLVLIAAFTIWVSSLQPVFLPVLVIPVFISFLKVKDEYREWSLS